MHEVIYIYDNTYPFKFIFKKKKIYDEVTEDIFDMSNVRIFKEIERKNGGCLYFVMSSVS